MLNPHVTYVYKGDEVFLEGSVAKNPSNQILYKIKPIKQDTVIGQWEKWVLPKELYLISTKKLIRENMDTYHDTHYLELLEEVLETGQSTSDRTGTGTFSTFGKRLEFDLSDGTIPVLTSKKIHLKSIIHEILWYLKGDSSIDYLKEKGVRIWNEWAVDDDIGPIYGPNWRRWKTPDGNEIDQIDTVIHQIKNNPNSRRMIVSAWNVSNLPDEALSPEDNVNSGKGALAPCHAFFQFYVNKGTLSCQLYQRSADMFLGVPFNIAQYSILLRMVAQVCGLQPGKFIWIGGDVHIYTNHVRQVKEQLNRSFEKSPKLSFSRNVEHIDNFQFDDFVISDYHPQPAIKAQVSK